MSVAADNDELEVVLEDNSRQPLPGGNPAEYLRAGKNLEMFEQQLLSSGRMLYVQPDQLRWELLPAASGFVLQGIKGCAGMA